MAALRVCFLLLSALALTSFVATTPIDDAATEVDDAKDIDSISIPTPIDDLPSAFDPRDDDNDDDGEEGLGPDALIEGIPIMSLTAEEVAMIEDEIDRRDEAELDLLVTRKIAHERGTQAPDAPQPTRKRRSLLMGFASRFLVQAARMLFRGSRFLKLTRSGSRFTKHYLKTGSYKDALNDFNRFKPGNLKSFNGKISGKSGQVGNHKLTVRNGSSNGNPTLEIQSPRGRGTLVRKFRYQGGAGKSGIFGIKLPF